MKRAILTLTFTLILAGVIYSNPSDEQIRQAAAILGLPFADLKQFVQSYHARSIPTGTIEINARDLSQEFQNNRLRATNQYNNTTLKITGRVNSIKQNFSGVYYLELVGTSPGLYGIYVFFQSSELNRLANVSPGQSVTIVGKFKEYDGYEVYIIDALFQ